MTVPGVASDLLKLLGLTLVFLWLLSPRLGLPTFAEAPKSEGVSYAEAAQAVKKVLDNVKQQVQVPAPDWATKEELDWSQEDIQAHHTALHRSLSPKLLHSMREVAFHASLSYFPWTLPSQQRDDLFARMRSRLAREAEECAVAAPTFRVYVNLLAARWSSLQALPTYDAKQGFVFLRNIHVTPIEGGMPLLTTLLRNEHSAMCIDEDFAHVPTTRYDTVWLTSDELPSGVILQGDEARCAQHFDDVFRGLWPCRVEQRIPKNQ